MMKPISVLPVPHSSNPCQGPHVPASTLTVSCRFVFSISRAQTANMELSMPAVPNISCSAGQICTWINPREADSAAATQTMFHDLACIWQDTNAQAQRDRAVMTIRLGIDCFAMAHEVYESLADRNRYVYPAKTVYCGQLQAEGEKGLLIGVAYSLLILKACKERPVFMMLCACNKDCPGNIILW